MTEQYELIGHDEYYSDKLAKATPPVASKPKPIKKQKPGASPLHHHQPVISSPVHVQKRSATLPPFGR